MTTVSLPCLPSEVIKKIVVLLPLRDLCTCMLVCKQWNEIISSEQFCKRYVLSHYDFDDEEVPTGHLKEWQDPEEWFYYWDENADKSNVYVFSDPPKRWKCGIVHLANYTLQSDKELKYKDFFRAVCILKRILKAAMELDLDCSAYANEGTGIVEVCLFPWNKESLPTAEDIISLFHFNPEMSKDPLVDTEVPDDDEDDDDEDSGVSWNTLRTFQDDNDGKKKAVAFFKWLKTIFNPFIRIAIGCESMNPVPCFILAQIAPGWVGGILTSLALT